MVSSKVSYMLVSVLLLLLVFPDMDKALGEQIHFRNRNRKLKETEHHDRATTDQSLARLPFPKKWFPTPVANCNAACLKRWKKAHGLLNAIPPPPSRFSKGKNI
ncbi:unnamed protein product [Eruca vesicaria subsp. sativa]|uniref:Uncharacterized protein n=1 Tax=Eruca vesicaria subsp. sativa TaxID=29727 RepID=A0ABC8LY27_ERUVS|nr:unnamed protein product [Eruca vesicaria subsp. sativa]